MSMTKIIGQKAPAIDKNSDYQTRKGKGQSGIKSYTETALKIGSLTCFVVDLHIQDFDVYACQNNRSIPLQL